MTKLLLALTLVGLHAAAAGAQEGRPAGQPAPTLSPELAEARRLNDELTALYKAGKFEEAVPLGRRVLELRERALGGEDLAGVDAVRRWRFTPTLLDGTPVRVTGVVTVNFILQ